MDGFADFEQRTTHDVDRDELIRGPVQLWREWWQAEATRDPGLAQAGFVRTSADLGGLGYTRAQIRTAIRRGRWVDVGRGLVAPLDLSRDLPEIGADFVLARRRHVLASAGVGRRRPHDVIAGRSAAIAHGLPTVRVPDTPELLARDVGGGRRRPAHVYTAAVGPLETTSWFGCPLTDPARTLVELGRHDRYDAIMAADAALREDIVTPADLREAWERARGWPGVRQARAVLAQADPLAESPLESITRLRMHQDGLPAPSLQVWIGPYRVDFYWPRYGFVLEADGRVKYTSEERWREKQREQALRRLGVRRVERVTWPDVFGGWRATSELLRAALHDPLLTPSGRDQGRNGNHTG